MEKEKELNSQLKAEVNLRFDELFKKIGNNRPQLSNKVVAEYKEINKELNRDKVDAHRGAELLRQVADIEKMAARQLPHLEKVVARPAVSAPPPPATKAKVAPSKPAKKVPPAKKKK